jgi:hypothetical protein
MNALCPQIRHLPAVRRGVKTSVSVRRGFKPPSQSESPLKRTETNTYHTFQSAGGLNPRLKAKVL